MANRKTVINIIELDDNKRYSKMTLLLEPMSDSYDNVTYTIQKRFKSLYEAEEYIKITDLSKYSQPMVLSVPYNTPQPLYDGSQILMNRANYNVINGEVDYSSSVCDEESTLYDDENVVSKRDRYRSAFLDYMNQCDPD